MSAVDRSLYGAVTTAVSTMIGEYCVIGCPKEARLREWQEQRVEVGGQAAPVVIGERCLIQHHVTIYEGVRIGDDCFIEDRVRIGYNSTIGRGSRLVYGAYLCDRVQIGEHTRIAGFICDGTTIGDRSTVMGQLVHEYCRPHQDWWQVDELSPVIEHDSVIGYGAKVIGGVQIGPCSYVAAGAIVTKDVPSGQIVTGVNQQTSIEQWRGEKLQALVAHWTTAIRLGLRLP